MNTLQVIPTLQVAVNGAPLPQADLLGLERVMVRQQISQPARCELIFSGSLKLVPGNDLRLALENQPTPMFEGKITAVEYSYGPSREFEMRIRGYDPLHQLRQQQAPRAHTDLTVASLAADLAAGVGLSIQAEQAGPIWKYLIQHEQSDLEFLADLADRCGLYFAVHDGALQLFTLEGIGEVLPLTLYDSLLEATFELNADTACPAVYAEGWNVLQSDPQSATASTARSQRQNVVDSGGASVRTLLNQATEDLAQAEAVAQAELDWRVAQEIELWGITEGDPRLHPGAVIRVDGVDAPLAGNYVVMEAIHTIDAEKGYLVELSTHPPARRQPRPASVTAPGIVTQIEDPLNLGRVRVRLTTFSDVETDWIAVLSAGAGTGKGLIALPNVGDYVLVLLSREDPARGIVLGGLYGVDAPPDVGLENGARRRFTLRTSSGHQIQMDDAVPSLTIQDSRGSFITLAPDKVTLHSTADLDIGAPGRKVTIHGQSIDFNRS